MSIAAGGQEKGGLARRARERCGSTSGAWGGTHNAPAPSMKLGRHFV